MIPYIIVYGYENRRLKMAKKSMELRLSEESMLRINLTQEREITRKKCLEIFGRR